MKRRPILSGKKKPTQLSEMPSKNSKPSSLFDHTTKIQQKLAKLKQQINEKKKLTTMTKIKPQLQQTSHMDKQLLTFLEGINLSNYKQVMMENGIDSFQILKDIKQKQLEQIGIVKGHALKIMVSLRKLLESREKASRKELSSAETAQNSHKITSKAQKGKIKPKQTKQLNKHSTETNSKPTKNQPLQIVMQTDQAFGPEQQQLPKRRYFCLYCYQVCQTQFCGQDCEESYNKMFQKYQKNLAKVQQLFGSKLERATQLKQQEIDENQFVSDLEFLDAKYHNESQQQSRDFNDDIYMEALNMIKATNDQRREQGMQKVLEENQQQKRKERKQQEDS